MKNPVPIDGSVFSFRTRPFSEFAPPPQIDLPRSRYLRPITSSSLWRYKVEYGMRRPH